MGRLELPIPELSNDSLSWSAKEIEKRIRTQTPPSLRNSISVRPYRRGDGTGIRIDYADEAESFVFAAIEYPKGSSRHEDDVPHGRAR